MTKIAAIVLAVFSALASAFLWTKVLPQLQDTNNIQNQKIESIKDDIEQLSDKHLYQHNVHIYSGYSYSPTISVVFSYVANYDTKINNYSTLENNFVDYGQFNINGYKISQSAVEVFYYRIYHLENVGFRLQGYNIDDGSTVTQTINNTFNYEDNIIQIY